MDQAILHPPKKRTRKTLARAPRTNGTGADRAGTAHSDARSRLDEVGYVWFRLHSGSRGVGNGIGTMFMRLEPRTDGHGAVGGHAVMALM